MIMELSKSNKLMRQAMKDIKKNDFKELNGNLILFSDFLNFDLIKLKNFFLIKNFISDKNNIKFYAQTDHNFSRFESSLNHFHIFDFLIKEDRGLALLQVGLSVAKILALQLKYSFPRVKFNVTIGYDVINEFGLNDCVISFHKFRKKEGSVLGDDFENDKTHALGIIEV